MKNPFAVRKTDVALLLLYRPAAARDVISGGDVAPIEGRFLPRAHAVRPKHRRVVAA